MKISVINGANLNLLGSREPTIYGNETLKDLEDYLRKEFPNINFIFYQSNIEGELVNMLHEAAKTSDAIIFNPGGYAHTSVVLADAIAAIRVPVIEVHLSNIYARESYRQQSLTSSKCVGTITGFKKDSYVLAVHAILLLKKVNG